MTGKEMAKFRAQVFSISALQEIATECGNITKAMMEEGKDAFADGKGLDVSLEYSKEADIFRQAQYYLNQIILLANETGE